MSKCLCNVVEGYILFEENLASLWRYFKDAMRCFIDSRLTNHSEVFDNFVWCCKRISCTAQIASVYFSLKSMLRSYNISFFFYVLIQHHELKSNRINSFATNTGSSCKITLRHVLFVVVWRRGKIIVSMQSTIFLGSNWAHILRNCHNTLTTLSSTEADKITHWTTRIYTTRILSTGKI